MDNVHMCLRKNKFKILLVSLYNDEAYGLRILHSVLVNDGFDCRMCFIKLSSKSNNRDIHNRLTEEEIRLFKDLVNDLGPDLIGFSLTSTSFSAYKRIHNHIKNYKIIIGGWQASLQPEDTIKYCDMLCVGEGEGPILEVASNMYAGKGLDNTRNIWINNGSTVIKNDVRPLISDLNYPMIRLEDRYSYSIENGKIVNKEPYKANTRYGTMIGRGCPHHCSYCSNSYMVKNVYRNWNNIRYRRPEHIIDELLKAKEELSNIERINFYDEVFAPPKEWARDFFFRLKESIQLPFYCMFYPGSCSEDTAKMLREAGLAGVWLGVQSGSERVRREVFKRYYTNKAISEQANILRRYDISVRYDFIFDNPFESDEEKKETIKLMKELPRPCSFNMFSLKYFPNTEITKMALKKNIITEKDIETQLKDDYQDYLVSKEKEEKVLNLIAPAGTAQ